MTSKRIESISYDFASRKVSQERPPFLKVSNGSSSEGFIEISIPFIETPTILPSIYLLIVPTYLEPKYIKTGEDLYTQDILFYELDILDNGNARIHWIIDTGALQPDTGNCYAINFKVTSTYQKTKCSIDVVIKITSES